MAVIMSLDDVVIYRTNNDTIEKYSMYEVPASSSTLKKQYKYTVKVGSTNDASTLQD